ncbi:DEAD/DEAH box helicase [Endozoicomonas numazuensis]|uniref:DEAD/DEAH box helicase n=1 Tax=Endozoicomonas numazuensis TaxID=1137799 RepID=UPI0009DF8EFF|nr:AAA domain-containing protein [Endozoicomonas numazuensis]
MKLINSCLLEPEIIRLRPLDQDEYIKSQWQQGDEAYLISRQGDIYINQQDHLLPVEIIDHEDKVKTLVAQRNTFWVITALTPQDIYLQKCTVSARVENSFKIGVDEWTAENLSSKNVITSDSVNDAIQWLSDEFLLESDRTSGVFTKIPARRSEDTLTLLGHEWQAILEVSPDNTTTLKHIQRAQRSDEAIGVLEGEIIFADTSQQSVVNSKEAKRKFEEALRSHGSYVSLWEDYSNTDWELVVEQAREVGFFRYTKTAAKGEESILWEFSAEDEAALKGFLERFDALDSKDFQIESSGTKPDWLDNEKAVHESGFDHVQDKVSGELYRRNQNGLVLKLDDQRKQDRPASDGYLYLSLSGHITNRNRRQKAKDQIQSGNNPMPQLHRLLEGYAEGARRRNTLRALTPYAREVFKGGSPTSKQESAIDIALNTPDIAIIVGPPGTGKTQVITALQRRLAEESGNHELNHQTLISSFQHDAVDNVIARSDVFGLPAVKVGGRGGKKSDTSADPVDTWCQKKHQDVGLKLSDYLDSKPFLGTLRELFTSVSTLQVAPMLPEERQQKLDEISSLLEKLYKECSVRLPSSIRTDWDIWAEEHKVSLHSQKMGLDDLLIRRIRSLRTTPDSYADDGSEQAWALLDQVYIYPDLLNTSQKELLEQLANSFDCVTTEQLEQLSELQNMLLDHTRHDYRPPVLKTVIDKQGCQILNALLEAIREKIESSQLGEYAVLENYQQSLLNEPYRVREAAQSYTSILAATCQQSASNQMSALKNVDFQNDINFESVIVDEAARANPLDLFIPMAMAKRRVVLVGDHRQLPHMLEPEVEKTMSVRDELDANRQEMLKESLFERLFKQLKKLEAQDGRSRVITLDTQFRMHPVLGDFVSRNFYENHKEERIKSGRPEDDFKHGLKDFENKVCAWIDLPKSDGNWKRRGTSRYRTIEAREIALRIKKMMEENLNTSFGIITFYSAQRDEILEQLKQIDVAEKVHGNYKIRSQWSTLANGDERLRVGSVDAFQGKEFNVVFLSTVLTNSASLPDLSDDKAVRKKYGFLTLENRLNVAMSRQQQLLICVGDAEMFKSEEAEKVVPAMNAFYELCGGEHGKIVH